MSIPFKTMVENSSLATVADTLKMYVRSVSGSGTSEHITWADLKAAILGVANTWTGQQTVENDVRIHSTAADLYLVDTDGVSAQRAYRVRVSGSVFRADRLNEAGATGQGSSLTTVWSFDGSDDSLDLSGNDSVALPADTAVTVDGTALSDRYEPVQTVASQAEMEAGTETAVRSMSPLRVSQAISALASGGSSLTVVDKTSDETITNDDTLTADSDLSFTMAANTRYRGAVFVIYSGHTAPDFKERLVFPSSTGWVARHAVRDSNGSLVDARSEVFTAATETQTWNCDFGTAYEVQLNVLYFDVTCGGTGGTFAYEWAQTGASGTDTTVYARSRIEYEVVS